MAEPVEVAIESALLTRLLALTFSPAIPVAVPNVAFTPPSAAPGIVWLRGSFLPADTYALGLSYASTNQHYGIFQVDVFYNQGQGELAPARIAAAVIQYFKRGTQLTKDGFRIEVTDTPRRSAMIKDDPWIMIPVSIPYKTYAPNPT
jgi:hypothetical protein